MRTKKYQDQKVPGPKSIRTKNLTKNLVIKLTMGDSLLGIVNIFE